MIKVGGDTFNPGGAETLTISGLDATASSATLKLGTLEVSGSLSSSDWVFTFTADQTGSLAPYTRYNPQIVYDAGDAVTIRLTTGARKESTSAVTPPSATVVAQITGGNGITTAPAAGITDKGSVAIDSSWVESNLLPFTMIPQPGSSNAITTRIKAWSPSQSALVTLVAESFYQAHGGSNATGDVVLKSGGVEAVLMYFGYTITHTGAHRSLPMDSTSSASGIMLTTTGDVTLARGGAVDDADDGYFVCLLYEAST